MKCIHAWIYLCDLKKRNNLRIIFFMSFGPAQKLPCSVVFVMPDIQDRLLFFGYMATSKTCRILWVFK